MEEKNNVTLAIKFDEKLACQIKEISKEEGRPLANFVRHRMRQSIKKDIEKYNL